MKKALITIAIVVLIIIFNLLLLSCGIKTGTTTSSTTAKIENSTVTVNTENQSNINDYNNRLKEFSQFLTDYQNATLKINQDIADLSNKLIEATKSKDNKKFEAYCQVEIDKLEELINSLSKIYVPEIAKEYYSYELDRLTKAKQWLSYILDFTLSTNFDVSKADSLHDEGYIARIKADKELERIEKGFNKEAEELGLPKPYPNL